MAAKSTAFSFGRPTRLATRRTARSGLSQLNRYGLLSAQNRFGVFGAGADN